MKYINFKQIIIKNFLSIGETPVTVDFKPGLHIITGSNKDKVDRRNGVGKSTIADAIHFAVFGETLRELKKEHITNNNTLSKCDVTLNFEVINDQNRKHNYQITRTLNPSKCFLYKNDKDVTRDSIPNTNARINDVINTTSQIFQNCVIMTVNNTTPFMAKKRVDKRKFIEGILNLQVFSNMLSTLRTEYNTIKRDFDVECAKYDEIQNTLEAYNEQKKKLTQEKNNRIKELQQRNTNNINETQSLNKKIKKFKILNLTEINNKRNKLTEKYDLCNNAILTTKEHIIEIETKINYKKNNMAEIGTDQDSCPVCLRTISDHDKQHIENERTKINDEITHHKIEIDDYNNKVNKYVKLTTKLKNAQIKSTNTINTYNLELKEIENIKSKINQLNEWNKEIRQDIDIAKKDTSKFDEFIEQNKNRLRDVKTEINRIKDSINMLDIVKFVVSEEGVKSYIVKKILQLLNHKLAYYLKKMDSNCMCVFNEYFEEQIIDERGKMCSYFNFSGAERKNIDLACLFTFMDIRRLQGDVAFNFSVYDELFDSSLDETGVFMVIKLLKERISKFNESIFVISHRRESVKQATGDVIFLEKKNGITTRVAFDNELIKI